MVAHTQDQIVEGASREPLEDWAGRVLTYTMFGIVLSAVVAGSIAMTVLLVGRIFQSGWQITSTNWSADDVLGFGVIVMGPRAAIQMWKGARDLKRR